MRTNGQMLVLRHDGRDISEIPIHPPRVVRLLRLFVQSVCFFVELNDFVL